MVDVKRIELYATARKDARGWVINPIEDAGIGYHQIANIHMASLNPGVERGNHYHAKATERLVVFGGQASFYWQLQDETLINHELIRDGKPVLFQIPPGVIHTIKNDSNQEIFIMAFLDSDKPDTVRVSNSIVKA